MRLSKVALVGVGSLAVAGAAQAGLVTYTADLTGVTSSALDNIFFSTIDLASAGGQVVEMGWTDVYMTLHYNSGATTWPAYANEQYLGFYNATSLGATGFLGTYPFSGTTSATSGTGDIPLGPAAFGPFDLTGFNRYIPATGEVAFKAVGIWDDGSGMPMATYTGGTMWIVVDQVPAPGALALLGLAGLARRRRR